MLKVCEYLEILLEFLNDWLLNNQIINYATYVGNIGNLAYICYLQ